MIRAFVAIELTDSLRNEIAGVQRAFRSMLDQAAPAAHVSWVRPESMHLTLKFLGDVAESSVTRLHDEIGGAAPEWRAIDIPLQRLGGFPRLREPRNLWLGPDERWEQDADATHLQTIARTIDECAARLGIAREKRPYSPHLTLARIKAGERQIGQALTSTLEKEPLGLHLPVRTITLLKSQLDSKGAIHTPLWSLNLK